MASVNKVILVGHLGKDPETRNTGAGMVANLTLATSDKWKDKATGEQREATEWHRVVLWGRTAEIAQQYLRKGSAVYIEGRLQTRKWQDQNGQDRYTTEIRADSLQMLGGKGSSSSATADTAQQPPAAAPMPSAAPAYDIGDDIPF